MSLELSVVLPFYNEQDNVAPLVRELVSALSGKFGYELVAVDDGSCDATANILAELAHQTPELRTVVLPRNCGQSAAVANGVAAARAPLVVTLDGDGQNPPSEIPGLVQAYRQAVTQRPLLVIGWRKQRRDGQLKRLSSRLANAVRAWLLRDDCPDTGCGLRVFSRDNFLQLPRFNHMHRFLPALYRRAGGEIVVVPVAHRPRMLGQSKYGVNNRLWVGLLDMIGVLWLNARPCPIFPQTQQEKDDGRGQ